MKYNNFYYITTTCVLYLPYVTHCLERKEFTWVKTGLTFEGLSKIWTNEVTIDGRKSTTIRIAQCTARYTKIC